MVMTWYMAVFLGLVQGFAEFLPISSSGHLLLFEHWFGIPDGGLLFNIILHLATLLAVVVVYRQRLWQMVTHPWQRENWLLVTATVISCVIVVAFNQVIERCFTFAALPWAFLGAGVFLLLPRWVSFPVNEHRWCPTIWMGVAQGIAVVPGLSRSGLTITTGRLAGMTPAAATDFSFLMSIPIIIASLCYEIIRGGQIATGNSGYLVLAFVTAFVAGLVAIKVMLNLTRKLDLGWFALYLLLLGGGLLLQRGF